MTDQQKGHGKALVGLSGAFRDGRNKALREMIARLASARPAGAGPFRIADLGGSFAYWERVGIGFLDAHDVEVTCINMTEGELKVAPQISPRLIARIGNACNLTDHADQSFDMVHSNSVVEHVGRFPDMLDFAREVRRLAPAYYVQTPYVWFPVDPHSPRLPFYHWLPISLQLKLQRTMKLGWSDPAKDVAHAMRHIDGTVLLDRTRFHYLFPDARTRFEWLLFLPKSMIVERG